MQICLREILKNSKLNLHFSSITKITKSYIPALAVKFLFFVYYTWNIHVFSLDRILFCAIFDSTVSREIEECDTKVLFFSCVSVLYPQKSIVSWINAS